MKLALIGQNIQHSLSPQLQKLNAQAWAKSLEFDLIDCSDVEFDAFISNKKWLIYKGLNVTTPYKEKAYEACDYLSSSAQCLEAVNTLKSKQGKLYGHNTDADGVEFLLKKIKASTSCLDAQAVILGVGGASRAAAYALSRLGVGHFLWVSRNQIRAVDCLAWCKIHFPQSKATWLGPNGQTIGHQLDHKESALLVSGTPPLPQSAWEALAVNYQKNLGLNFGLTPKATLIDLNYGIERTMGSRAYSLTQDLNFCDGLSMLVGQGVSSFDWWTGLQSSPDSIYEQMLKN